MWLLQSPYGAVPVGSSKHERCVLQATCFGTLWPKREAATSIAADREGRFSLLGRWQSAGRSADRLRKSVIGALAPKKGGEPGKSFYGLPFHFFKTPDKLERSQQEVRLPAGFLIKFRGTGTRTQSHTHPMGAC